MEILKTTFAKTFLVLTIICFTRFIGYSQDSKATLDAVSNSYKLEQNKEYSKGIEEIKKVYTADNYFLNMRLGWLNYSAGQYSEAVKYYQVAVSLMPNSIEAKLAFTYPASAMGNTDQVKNIYIDILKIDPNNSTSNYYLGLILYNRNDFESAYKYFEKVISLFPLDYYSNLMFGWTNFKLGKLKEAKIIFNKVLLISPNDKSALEGLSLIK